MHLWRAHADAIMVGIGTARADDPSLTVRLPGLSDRSPLRIVLDSTLRLTPSTHLVRGARDIPTLVVTGRHTPAHARRMLASFGVELLPVATDAAGRIDLRAAMIALAERGLTRICSEGGPALADALAGHDLIDACTLITAPANSAARAACRPSGRTSPTACPTAPCARSRPGTSVPTRPSPTRGFEMFTGLVTDVGRVVSIEGGERLARIVIESAYDPATIALGASIACSGPCLTAVSIAPHGTGCRFAVDAAAETLARTTVGAWREGTRVNLERSLKLGDEMGGHLVTGHVDGVAEIVARETVTGEDNPWGASERFTLRAPAALAGFIAEKGSVCLDGTSLTVNTVDGTDFSVLLIPHSLSVTTWEDRRAGDRVNLEVDLIARYAARLAEARGLMQG